MSVSQPGSWASRTGQAHSKVLRRPRSLLVADLFLVGMFVALARWLLGGLFVSGFLADPDSVPPFVVDAGLDGLQALLAFGLPLVLVAVTAFRLRFTHQARWPWTPLIIAWVGLAFVETPIASPDFTAAVFVVGAFPALLIGNHQRYLRQAAGLPWMEPRWSPLRRTLTLIGAIVVVVWIAAYFFGAVMSMMDMGFKLPDGTTSIPFRGP